MIASGIKNRILANAGKNTPSSWREFERYPPVKYPVCLRLLFSRRDSHLVEYLKAVLGKMPKDRARYRRTFNRYTSGISFQCYFNVRFGLEPL